MAKVKIEGISRTFISALELARHLQTLNTDSKGPRRLRAARCVAKDSGQRESELGNGRFP